MKTTKKVKMPVKPSVSAKEVDALAEHYMETDNACKDASGELNRSKEHIKALAGSFGVKTPDGKELLKGKRYQIGYQVVNRSGGIDPELVKKQPAIWKKCLSLQFDANLLAKLVKTKQVTNKQVLAMCFDDRPSQRIVVEPLGGKPAADQEQMED